MNDDNSTNQSSQNSSIGIFGMPMSIPSDVQSNTSGVQNTQPIASADKKTQEDDITSIGVTFVDDQEEIPAETNIFSQNSSFKDKEEEAVKSLIQPEISSVSNPIQQSNIPQEIISNDVPTQELEDDFSKTFSGSSFSSTQNQESSDDHLKIEEEKLTRLHKELKEKAAAKKIVVKQRLEKLRSEKESLGKELEEIKEIEGIALKIEEKLKALVSIDGEIDSLELQAKEELQ